MTETTERSALPVSATNPAAAELAHSEMSLFDHLRELRKRIFYSTFGILVGSIIAYSYTPEILKLLSAPFDQAFHNASLIGTGPAEAFVLKMKMAIFAGILVSSPFSFFQFWLFISPGLYEREKKWVLPFVIAASLLFLLGVWFCYVAVLPVAFDFFAEEYRSIGIAPTLRVSEHLSVVAQGLIGFGAVFETPILAFVLGRAGFITHRTLIEFGRYAVVVIFIIAAVLTPPDVLSQLLMAGPLLVLYGLSIGILYFTARQPPELTDENK